MMHCRWLVHVCGALSVNTFCCVLGQYYSSLPHPEVWEGTFSKQIVARQSRVDYNIISSNIRRGVGGREGRGLRRGMASTLHSPFTQWNPELIAVTMDCLNSSLCHTRSIIKFQVTCSHVLHTHSKLVTFVVEFYQQPAISPIASRENQAYSLVTGVTVWVMALNDNPAYSLPPVSFPISGSY